MSQRTDLSTVGVLYCGDLGAALARLLKRAGIRVVTTCDGRSSQTRQRAEAVEVEILPTLDSVIAASDVIISLVLPEAAHAVASDYAERRLVCPDRSLFVDANSIDLQTLAAIESTLAAADIRFVDAAIHGGAKSLEQMGVLYVSGPDSDVIQGLCDSSLQVRSMGQQLGQAKRMKMLLGGLSKGLNALFLEMGILSHNTAMLDEFLDEAKRFYPEIMTAIDRMLPTYPHHTARRVKELQGIEALARSVNAPHQVVQSANCLFQAAAGAWHNELQTNVEMDISRVITVAASATVQVDPDE